MNNTPVLHDVLLVGGGHSHALLIRQWAMRPLPGVRLTLVSDGVMTPYSGMLPGLVAGHYTREQVHIDLLRLCTLAGVRFINTRMTAIDPAAKRISLSGRPDLHYDLVSLDTGSTPDLSVPGAGEFSTPVKPVHAFHERWLAIGERLAQADQSEAMSVGVVGSGAGGFEILMAMRHALPRQSATLHWFLRGELPLKGRPTKVRVQALETAQDAGITVHTGFDVSEVAAGPQLIAKDGRTVALDELLWCTGAVGPAWVRAAGFDTDARGFVATDAYLRSLSHPTVFATGDIGTQRDTPSPKAGVYAVRQAPYLYQNIRRSLLGETLRRYRPQHDFLSLMATGPKQAIASRGPLMVCGAWVWRWKDHIDQSFMQRVQDLPPMKPQTSQPVIPKALLEQSDNDSAARTHTDSESVLDAALQESLRTGIKCRGCGAKLAGEVLDSGLANITAATTADDVQQGLTDARDAAVFDPGARVVMQSVDQLNAFVDDPWLFARIAVRHALADVLSQGGQPHSAQLLLTLPPAAMRVQQHELDLILAGVSSALEEEGMVLLGGHTSEGPELQIGLVVNGLGNHSSPDDLACQANDRLVLTRPLGSGVLLAAMMRGLANGLDVEAVVQKMQQSQRPALDILHAHGARVMTDVTGFGLIGHLDRMLSTTGFCAQLSVADVPMYGAALKLAEDGVQSSLYPANAQVFIRMHVDASVSAAHKRLLADPQTAGGFLAVLPAETAEQALTALGATGEGAALIGHVQPRQELGRHHLR